MPAVKGVGFSKQHSITVNVKGVGEDVSDLKYTLLKIWGITFSFLFLRHSIILLRRIRGIHD